LPHLLIRSNVAKMSGHSGGRLGMEDIKHRGQADKRFPLN
jgi:hypothetical protein